MLRRILAVFLFAWISVGLLWGIANSYVDETPDIATLEDDLTLLASHTNTLNNNLSDFSSVPSDLGSDMPYQNGTGSWGNYTDVLGHVWNGHDAEIAVYNSMTVQPQRITEATNELTQALSGVIDDINNSVVGQKIATAQVSLTGITDSIPVGITNLCNFVLNFSGLEGVLDLMGTFLLAYVFLDGFLSVIDGWRSGVENALG